MAEIQDFLIFQFILKLSYSKSFHNTLDYASTANIEEVVKFYNLGNKTFETDFNIVTLTELRSEYRNISSKIAKYRDTLDILGGPVVSMVGPMSHNYLRSQKTGISKP